ncbi:hypothetical protein ASG51_05255 [Methylobacterium sp. Leaf465]|uniref:hypothetical protein n=1 Tax=Methylobacterium sp. Leaf465 TaxID=1736385 RepID=UPI0006FF8B04|nr:hypothetical protein [Methylobacterium sp. Leaf465]KQT80016.1 hypothetical protein ASG51_05255 [Methylobacterium sp. Leaf465]
MAQILAFPPTTTSDGLSRLKAQLEHDFAAGVDLGSRRAQIAALSASLDHLLGALERTTGEVFRDGPEPDPDALRTRNAVANLIACVKDLIATIDGLFLRNRALAETPRAPVGHNDDPGAVARSGRCRVSPSLPA